MEDQFKGSVWHNEFPNPALENTRKERKNMEYDSVAKIYWSIGEVAEMLKVNPSALRFWESRCPWIRVKKGKNGNRHYTSNNIESTSNVLLLTRWLGLSEFGINKAYKFKYLDRLVELAKQEQQKALENEIENHG